MVEQLHCKHLVLRVRVPCPAPTGVGNRFSFLQSGTACVYTASLCNWGMGWHFHRAVAQRQSGIEAREAQQRFTEHRLLAKRSDYPG